MPRFSEARKYMHPYIKSAKYFTWNHFWGLLNISQLDKDSFRVLCWKMLSAGTIGRNDQLRFVQLALCLQLSVVEVEINSIYRTHCVAIYWIVCQTLNGLTVAQRQLLAATETLTLSFQNCYKIMNLWSFDSTCHIPQIVLFLFCSSGSSHSPSLMSTFNNSSHSLWHVAKRFWRR